MEHSTEVTHIATCAECLAHRYGGSWWTYLDQDLPWDAPNEAEVIPLPDRCAKDRHVWVAVWICKTCGEAEVTP